MIDISASLKSPLTDEQIIRASHLATELFEMMAKAGLEKWQIMGVADRRLVWELREEIEQLKNDRQSPEVS